jgi:hypothetical protein
MQVISLKEAERRAVIHAEQLIQKLEEINKEFTDCPEPLIPPREKRAALIQNHLHFLAERYFIKA